MIRKFPISAGLVQDDQTILGNFIEWFGALFGIVMALVLVQVWSRHSQVNDELDKEADALTLLIKICRWLPDSSFKQRVAVNVKTYCEVMIKTQTRDAKDNQYAIAPLNQLHRDMGKLLIDSSFPEPLIGELLRLINEVIDTRGDRLAHIKDRIPTPLWWLIFGTSMVWLFAFYTLQIENPRLATFVTGGSLLTVSALLFLIKDIDEHAGGFWRAQFEHFFEPRQESEKLLNEIPSETIGPSDNVTKIGH